jgi:hypothetical protein
VNGSDLGASLEREGGVSKGGRAGAGEGEESGVGSFRTGLGEGFWGESDDSVDSSVGSGSRGPSSILGGLGDGAMGDSAGGGGMDSCLGKGDIGCWNTQFCW